MDIELRDELSEPPPGRPPWLRHRAVAVAVVLGLAVGFAVATVRDDRRALSVARDKVVPTPAPSPSPAADPVLTSAMAARMVDQVRVYNKTEPATVEVVDVVLMTLLRDNLNRLDTVRSYPAGDYRLQIICLGDGEIWALFRIGDDESHVDMDCHSDHVLVTQLLLTAKAPGRRAVTLVTDSTAGLAVGYQILGTPTP